jgi:hypothetical protein
MRPGEGPASPETARPAPRDARPLPAGRAAPKGWASASGGGRSASRVGRYASSVVRHASRGARSPSSVVRPAPRGARPASKGGRPASSGAPSASRGTRSASSGEPSASSGKLSRRQIPAAGGQGGPIMSAVAAAGGAPTLRGPDGARAFVRWREGGTAARRGSAPNPATPSRESPQPSNLTSASPIAWVSRRHCARRPPAGTTSDRRGGARPHVARASPLAAARGIPAENEARRPPGGGRVRGGVESP